MTTPLDNLLSDHHLISRVTDALEAYLKLLPANTPEAHQDLHRFVTFFREYVDLSHNEKEDSLLLPAMVEAGADWDSGPMSSLRAQHNQERYLMRVLRQAAAQRGIWSTDELRHLVSVGQELVEFQRAHVRFESDHIYPEALQRLSVEAMAQLDEDLAEFEELRRSHGYDGWLRQLAEELIAHYGPKDGRAQEE